jgi:hypothetical protein
LHSHARAMWYTARDNIYIIMWSCPGRVICLSDLSNILAYYLDKTTLISVLYWVSNCPGNMPKYYPGNMPKTRPHYYINIVPSSISHSTSVRVQYDTLRGTIFTNIHAISLLLCIGECQSNSPFLKNNGAEALKRPRPIVF